MSDILRDIGKIENGDEISRRVIQVALAKTVELRALHAALMAGDSPANLRFPPSARHARNLSAQDYPVFNLERRMRRRGKTREFFKGLLPLLLGPVISLI